MLVYYDPWMAGIVLPLMIINGLIAIPYIDYNQKGNGYFTFVQRKFAISTFLFGFVVRRGWVLALPLTVLVALDPPQSGMAGALIALMILWPFAAAGGALGIGAGKALQRRMLRSTLKAARRRERAKKPAAPVRVSVAGR